MTKVLACMTCGCEVIVGKSVHRARCALCKRAKITDDHRRCVAQDKVKEQQKAYRSSAAFMERRRAYFKDYNKRPNAKEKHQQRAAAYVLKSEKYRLWREEYRQRPDQIKKTRERCRARWRMIASARNLIEALQLLQTMKGLIHGK